MTLIKNNSSDYSDLLDGPVGPKIVQMAIPTILAMLITSIYQLVDTYFVSSLGTNATAAVSINSSLDQFLIMAGTTLAMGGSSRISRLLGANEQEKANVALSTSFFIAVGIAVIFLIIGLIIMEPLVYLLGATDTCRRYSIEYATYILYAAPFMATSVVLNQCLRSEGSAKISLIGMGSGGVLNCILDPIFIFELNMGVAGASIATAISKFVSFSILVFPYLTGHSVVKLHLSSVRIKKDPLYDIISVGSSSLLRSGFAIISAIVLNNIAGKMSDSVLAGIGVATKIMMFPFSVIMGLGMGFSPVLGYNWGAKNLVRAWDSYIFATKAAIVAAVGMAILIWMFTKEIIIMFAGTDSAMLAIGILSIRAQCIALPIHAWVMIVNMFCAGRGDAKNSIFIATARQGTCFLPTAFVLAWTMGETGISIAQAIADFLSLGIAIPVMYSFKKQYGKLI